MATKRSRKEWTRAEEGRLESMASDGHCCSEIAEALGRTKPSIYDRAQRLGVRIPYPKGGHNGRGPALPDEVIRAIKILADAGTSVNEIVGVLRCKYRVSPSYVRGIRRGEYRSAALEEPKPCGQRGQACQAYPEQPLTKTEPTA